VNHLPLRQSVGVSGEAARVFARQDLLDALSRPGRFELVRLGDGGQILAVREAGLAEARVALQQAYGERVRFGAVSVHSQVDPVSGELLVPVMFLRVDAPRAHGPALRELLRERGVEAQDVAFERDRMVLRAEVPLTRLLGVERQVGERTDGAAHTMCWLLRYTAAGAVAADATVQA